MLKKYLYHVPNTIINKCYNSSQTKNKNKYFNLDST